MKNESLRGLSFFKEKLKPRNQYKFAVDVHYNDNGTANVSSLEFEEWNASDYKYASTKIVENIKPYESGQFYKRELPCIISILGEFNLDLVEYIIIDGYVWLGTVDKPGLGTYLYHAFNQKIPIIGVAKSKYDHTPQDEDFAIEFAYNTASLEGNTITLEEAKNFIQKMHGDNRIPTLLKKVDQIARGRIEY